MREIKKRYELRVDTLYAYDKLVEAVVAIHELNPSDRSGKICLLRDEKAIELLGEFIPRACGKDTITRKTTDGYEDYTIDVYISKDVASVLTTIIPNEYTPVEISHFSKEEAIDKYQLLKRAVMEE